jgi:signal transduction histidine kinase
VRLENLDTRLSIKVVDDGRGVAPSFKIEEATGLGLSIVRTLVTTELNGTIVMRPASCDDLREAGLGDYKVARGTVVELDVPTAID